MLGCARTAAELTVAISELASMHAALSGCTPSPAASLQPCCVMYAWNLCHHECSRLSIAPGQHAWAMLMHMACIGTNTQTQQPTKEGAATQGSAAGLRVAGTNLVLTACTDACVRKTAGPHKLIQEGVATHGAVAGPLNAGADLAQPTCTDARQRMRLRAAPTRLGRHSRPWGSSWSTGCWGRSCSPAARCGPAHILHASPAVSYHTCILQAWCTETQAWALAATELMQQAWCCAWQPC